MYMYVHVYVMYVIIVIIKQVTNQIIIVTIYLQNILKKNVQKILRYSNTVVYVENHIKVEMDYGDIRKNVQKYYKMNMIMEKQ